MAYILKEVTIRTNNTEKGISQISELWKDISAGKLPVLFDSEHIVITKMERKAIMILA